MSEHSKVTISTDHLEEIIAASGACASLSLIIEELRGGPQIMGVPHDEMLSAFDSWIENVMASVQSKIEALK